MNPGRYDFSGWATKNDLECADGLTIRRNAFQEDDGRVVPLVWQHKHDSPSAVIGHALLENRDEGVYVYGSFNNGELANDAREAVRHGDVTNLSIYANKLKKSGKDVLHGVIREVSLVLAGANPGAWIDRPILEHAEEPAEYVIEEAAIYTNEELIPYSEEQVSHADSEENNKDDKDETETEEIKMADKSIKDVINEMTPEQQDVVAYLLNEVSEAAKEEAEEAMSHCVFDNENDESLSHDALAAEVNAAMDDARKSHGSLREAFIAHGIDDLRVEGTETYGVKGINALYPEPHNANVPPAWINNDDAWVSIVMNGVKKTPFSRIKSMFADISSDEARAKGYVKGKRKLEQVFTLLKRTTTPTTIYKKQKFDRDDVVDITDFDVIAWVKGEMKVKLNEEHARAILTGDGRPTSSDDKISESNIRPVWTDDDLFTKRYVIEVDSAMTQNLELKNKAVVRTCVKAFDEYQGSGNTTMFAAPGLVSDLLLMEDTIGHRLYKSITELATALGVDRIVKVPYFRGLTRTGTIEIDGDTKVRTLQALVLDLKDYTCGNDKGGEETMFSDFDLDYNAMKYLIEKRGSGALTKPFSAFAIETVDA